MFSSHLRSIGQENAPEDTNGLGELNETPKVSSEDKSDEENED